MSAILYEYKAPQQDFNPEEILERAGLRELDLNIKSLQILNEMFVFYLAHYPQIFGLPCDSRFHDIYGVCDRLSGLIVNAQLYFEKQEE
ncbi:MAG: hypothetical protein ACK4TA_00130 [Saprospiraceae bacterium]